MNAKVDALLPLKTNWLHILLALSTGEQHGYAIMQDVLDRTHGKVRLWPATLYGSLRSLMDSDLIEESSRRPAEEDDDARRRYYRISPFGQRVLDAEVRRLEELLSSVKNARRAPAPEASSS